MLLVLLVLSFVSLAIRIAVVSIPLSDVHVVIAIVHLTIGECVGSFSVATVLAPPAHVFVAILVEVGPLSILLVICEGAGIAIPIGIGRLTIATADAL